MILDHHTPGQHLVPVEHFPGEDELIDVQDAYDPQPLEPPTFLYRGQSSRFFRRWPPEDTIDTPKDSYTLDSIIPRDYRYTEGLIRLGQKNNPNVTLVHSNDITVLRAMAVSVAIDQLNQVNSNQAFQAVLNMWSQTINGPDLYDHLGSIGQHCGLPTAYTDVTADKRVALWFATHNWESGDYIPDGTGIIYRINRHILSQAQEAVNAMNGWHDASAGRIIDIRNTPQILTPRPHHQHGFSLTSFESPWLLMELLNRNGIRGYLFDRGQTASTVNVLQQGNIAPAADSVHQELMAMRHNNAYDMEFQAMVDAAVQQQPPRLSQQYNIQNQALRDAIFVGWQPPIIP